MKKWIIFIVMTNVLIFPVFLQGQEEETPQEIPQPDRLFVRATIYPTANLSRYDYNNDVDLYEIRAYVELRDKTPIGDVIDDARVLVYSQSLEFNDDHYEKRIEISKDILAEEFELWIKTQDGREVRDTFLIPAWLIMLNPRPEIVENGQSLAIKWKYTRFGAPVDVHAYNFKTGNEICGKHNLFDNEITLPAEKLPESTIVRIWVMQSWLYKRFIRGRAVVGGSEVMVIPWSQVFIRTK